MSNAVGEFASKHPWMTFFIALSAIDAIVFVLAKPPVIAVNGMASTGAAAPPRPALPSQAKAPLHHHMPHFPRALYHMKHGQQPHVRLPVTQQALMAAFNRP